VTFAELRSLVFGSHGLGDYQAGLDAISIYVPGNDDERVDLAFWRVCLLSLLGRLVEACDVFAASLDDGHWWSEVALQDPDLDNLRSTPHWARLAAASIGHAETAKRAHRAPIDLASSNRLRATLVLLHGRAERPQTMIDRCASAAEDDLRMLALHGPEPYASNRFGWPVESCEQAVIDQLDSAGEVVTPILVGFSQGAGLAGWMAWSGRVPARGVILVAPAMNIRGVPIPSSALKLIPTYIEVGTDDWALGDTRRAAEGLTISGAPVRLEERAGMDHEWPRNSGEWLPEAINWVMGLTTKA
jgi:predicted esterase